MPNSSGLSVLVIIMVKINPRMTLMTDIETAINPE
mgnify:CR=1 FL=1